jgi:hypothetical protein
MARLQAGAERRERFCEDWIKQGNFSLSNYTLTLTTSDSLALKLSEPILVIARG